MSKKNIKEIKFILENCESVIIPFECFKTYELIKTEDNKVEKLKCLIEDNGRCEYGYGFDDRNSPMQRLAKYNDICFIILICEDNATEEVRVVWDGSSPNENKGQVSKLINYKTIEIEIEEYIEKYDINEVFEFAEGTELKGSDDEIYVIKGKDKDKYIERDSEPIVLKSKYIVMDYILLRDSNI